uniref:SAM domain-containing protein n=1 Tax=Anopheles minimus TaxID=112268 RepID=A0A182W1F8_9DIPT
MQLSQEQLFQYQQIQAYGGTIQVKQEYTPTPTGQPGSGGVDHQQQQQQQIQQQQQQQAQQQQQQAQQQQMQVLAEASGVAPSQSPHHAQTLQQQAAQQQQQQQQQSAAAAAAALNTMSPLQAMTTGQQLSSTDWPHGRMVVQQPISNAQYLQQLYGTQPIVFPPLGGQQQFQLITASKPFQGTPQMLTTTTGKQVIGTTGAGNFNGPFTFFSPVSVVNSQPQAQAQNLLPALSATAAQSAVAAATGATGNKAATTHQQDMQKAIQNAVAAASVAGATSGQKVQLQKLGTATGLTGAAGTAQQQNLAALTQQQAAAAAGQQCVQVSQAPMQTAQLLSPLQQQGPQQMQFSTQWPLPGQIWSTPNGLVASNPIIIRGTNPDGTPNVFFPSAQQALQQAPQTHNQTLALPCTITQSPQQVTQQQQQVQQQQQQQSGGQTNVNQATGATVGQGGQLTAATAGAAQSIGTSGGLQTQKTLTGPLGSKQGQRPQILPQGTSPIRPSVSTQTAQAQQSLLNKAGNKMRTKQPMVRPSAPLIKTELGTGTTTPQKLGQTTSQPTTPQQQLQQVVTSSGKMVLMNAGTALSPAVLNMPLLGDSKQQQQQQLQLQQQIKSAQQQQHQTNNQHILLQQQAIYQQQMMQQQQQQHQAQHQQAQQQAAAQQQQIQQLQQQILQQAAVAGQANQAQLLTSAAQQGQLVQATTAGGAQQGNIVHQLVFQQGQPNQPGMMINVSSDALLQQAQQQQQHAQQQQQQAQQQQQQAQQQQQQAQQNALQQLANQQTVGGQAGKGGTAAGTTTQMIMATSLGQAGGADRTTIVSQGGLQIDRNLLPVSITSMAGNPIVVTSNGATISPIHQTANQSNAGTAGGLQSAQQHHSQILVSSMPSSVHQSGQNPIVAMTSLSAAPMSVASIISSGTIPSISSGAITTTASLGQQQATLVASTGGATNAALLNTGKETDPKAISVAMHQLQQLSTPQKQIQQQQLLDNMNALAAAASGTMLGGSPIATGLTSLTGSPVTSTALSIMSAGGKIPTSMAQGGLMGSSPQSAVGGVKLGVFQAQASQQLQPGIVGASVDGKEKSPATSGGGTEAKDLDQSTATAGTLPSDSASDGQMNGSASTPMDTTPAPGTAPSVTNTNGSSTDSTPLASTVSVSSASVPLTSITTVSSGATATQNSTATAGTASTADDATKDFSAAASTVSSASSTTTTTTTMTTGASTTSSATPSTTMPTTAIATVTGTSAIPVSNIGPNGLLSTNGSVSSTGTIATSCVTTPSTGSSGGLPPKTTGSSADKGGIPKATIKPNVLTHVIEGFVIQEANEPFAVQRQRYPERDSSDEPPKKRSTNEGNSPLSPSNQTGDTGNCEVCGKAEMRSKMKRKRFCSASCARSAKQGSPDQISSSVQNGGNGVPLSSAPPTTPTTVATTVDPSIVGSMNGMLGTNPSGVVVPGVDPSLGTLPLGALATSPMLSSAMGGVLPNIKLDSDQQQQMQAVGLAQQMLQLQQQQGLLQPAATTGMGQGQPASNMLIADVPATPVTPVAVAAAAAAAAAVANNDEGSSILRWSVQDVYEFIRGLPGCADYAEDFVNQEIDGQALLLLKENHLVSTMDMKLGPALKIVARVNLMKATVAPAEGQPQPAP